MRRCHPLLLTLLISVPPLLAGCDLLGIEGANVVAARREAESKAIGGACRHAARSIEQCYESNKRADKAAVFAGWREMNDYMRENKIEAMPPPAASRAAEEAEAETEAAPPKKPAGKDVARPAAGKAPAAARH